MPEKSPIDKTLDEIVGKIDEAEKTCEKPNDTDKEEQDSGGVAAQDMS